MREMNIFLAILVYLVMAVILVAGVVLAVKGTFWLLILAALGFVLGVTKISILRQ
jgi:predicted neutral ceramidase superfamily lipid hydrolase